MKSITAKSLLHFLFFFLVILSYYIAKPIRNSLFLEWMGQQQLPLAYLASAAVSLIAALALHQLLKQAAPIKLIPASIGFFIIGLAGFRLLFATQEKLGAALSFALYLFISLFAVVSVSLFWAICNDTHTPDEGKKTYNFIGIGGILGGLTGGALTQMLAVKTGTENLLLLSAGILSLTLPLPWMIGAELKKEPAAANASLQVNASVKATRFRTKELFTNSFVIFIAGFVFLSTCLGSLMDFNFQGIIKDAGMAKDVRTAYFGRIFTLINVGGILIHLFITRPVLAKFGAGGGLLPIPVIATIGIVALWLFPELRTVSGIWIVYGAFAYSLTQVTRETLYIPVPGPLKYTAKFYIDTFIFRFGDAATALLLLFSNAVVHAPKAVIYSYGFIFCVCWMMLLAGLVRKSRTAA